LDDFGSAELPDDFFAELIESGAQLRSFNPSRVLRVAFRNHRKLVISDDRAAIVGGFNIGDEYAGDGVESGWRDLGMQIDGPLVRQLILSFARMFVAARMDYAALVEFSRHSRPDPPYLDRPSVLTSGPRFGGALLRRSFYADLDGAKSVDIIAAYFAPTWAMRRRLSKAAQNGRIRLVLPSKSDVSILRLAAQHLYSRLLRQGVKIYEYRPQILHAKLIVIDDAVYIGSCNLDVRSLRLNYELLLRIPDSALALQARQLIETDISHSAEVVPEVWRQNTRWWHNAERQLAYWLVNRLDPFLARRRLRGAR
jgi:cardiolipin synthase A/B